MRGRIDWAVAADGRRLRIFERRAANAPWQELQAEAQEHADPPSHAIGTDRPGRVFESAGPTRHAVEPRQDLHKAAEAAFAQAVAARLEQAATQHRYDRLVVIAAPVFLGQLRPQFGAATAERLAASLDRDLTHATAEDIAAHLGSLLA